MGYVPLSTEMNHNLKLAGASNFLFTVIGCCVRTKHTESSGPHHNSGEEDSAVVRFMLLRQQVVVDLNLQTTLVVCNGVFLIVLTFLHRTN